MRRRAAPSLSVERALARPAARRGTGLALGHRCVGRVEVPFLFVEPREDRTIVGDHSLFALDVVAELRQPALELGEALLDAGLLGVERVAG